MTRTPRFVFASLLALSFVPANLSAQPGPNRARVPCLHYEPELVHLWGTLARATAPEPGADASRIETAWVLRLADPICTTGPAEVNKPERDVRAIALVARGPMVAQFPQLEGTTVTATGTLSHSHAGHPHTAVLMAVKGLAARGRKAAPTDPSVPPAEAQATPPPPSRRIVASKPDELDRVVNDLESTLSPPAARELAAIQARWEDLAERDCRWEISLSEGGSATPELYRSCIERARRERARRLRELLR